MVREIITPTDSLFTMRLPDEMIGKKIEVIAFEITAEEIDNKPTKQERLQMIEEVTRPTRVDLRNYKFDRNEANNYDD